MNPMKIIASLLLCASGLLLLTGSQVLASGFHTAEFSASHVGQATAGLTLTENAGVVATLPAGMVRLDEGAHALAGATYFVSDFSYTTENGESGSTTSAPVLGPHLYGVYNTGSLAFGMGQYFPFNVDIQYADDWEGRSELTQEKLIVGYTALTAAMGIGDSSSIGLAINAVSGWAKLKQTIRVSPGVEVPLELGGTGETIGYQASYLFQSENLTFAASHAPGYTLEIDGTVAFETSHVPGLTASFPDGNGGVDISLPSVTEVGVAYHDRLKDPNYGVELNLVQTGWSTYEELVIRFETGKPAPTRVLERNWSDTLGIKVGGNYVISRSGDSSHKVRGGYYSDESAAPANTLDPAVPDGAGRDEVGLGYGYKSGTLILDAAAFLVHFRSSKTSGDNPFPASYGGDVWIYSLSAGMGF